MEMAKGEGPVVLEECVMDEPAEAWDEGDGSQVLVEEDAGSVEAISKRVSRFLSEHLSWICLIATAGTGS